MWDVFGVYFYFSWYLSSSLFFLCGACDTIFFLVVKSHRPSVSEGHSRFFRKRLNALECEGVWIGTPCSPRDWALLLERRGLVKTTMSQRSTRLPSETLST